jgi:membrane-bound lytic murein transglycosylase D
MMYLVKYHDALKLQPLQADLPFTSDTVCITKELHLRQVSKVLDIPITTLRVLNPQFRHDFLPAGQKSCILNLPANYGEKFRLLHDSIYHYRDSVVDASRQEVMFPVPSIIQHEPKIPAGKSCVYYTVKSGDNLGAIAARYHVTVNDLKTWNHMKSSMLSVGQKLIVYSTQHTGNNPPSKKR